LRWPENNGHLNLPTALLYRHAWLRSIQAAALIMNGGEEEFGNSACAVGSNSAHLLGVVEGK